MNYELAQGINGSPTYKKDHINFEIAAQEKQIIFLKCVKAGMASVCKTIFNSLYLRTIIGTKIRSYFIQNFCTFIWLQISKANENFR